MNNKEMKRLINDARKVAKPFRVTDDSFRLKDFDPGDTLQFTSEDKPRAKEALAMGIALLPSFKICFMPKTVGRYCLCFRRWTLAKSYKLIGGRPDSFFVGEL